MHCSKWSTGLLVTGATLFLACGAEHGAAGEDYDPVASQQAGLTTSIDFELVCQESVGFFPVDPSVARANVPADYDLYLENAAAQILILIQECRSAVWDGAELAPLKMSQVWIRRDGPFELIPISGAVMTEPTFYWYPHFGATDSKQLFLAAKQAGADFVIADSITRGPVTESARVSRVVEKQLNKESIGFDWVQTVNAVPPFPLGVRHRLVFLQGWTADDPNDLGKTVSNHARGIVVPQSLNNQIAVTPHPKSVLAKFGSVLNGLGHDFELHFTSTVTTTDPTE